MNLQSVVESGPEKPVRQACGLLRHCSNACREGPYLIVVSVIPGGNMAYREHHETKMFATDCVQLSERNIAPRRLRIQIVQMDTDC